MDKQFQAAATATDRANAEALEHWRRRRSEEASALLDAHLAAGHALTAAEQLRTRNNLAMFARERGDYAEALRVHDEAEGFADACRGTDPLLAGRFHKGRANTHQALGDPDAAIIEFTAASYYYEAAGAWRLKADVENDLAVLHAEAGRIEEALEHLAVALGSLPPDEEALATYEDTRALIALAEGSAERAIDFSYSSVTRLRRLGDDRLLVRSVKTSVRAGRAFLLEQEERRIRETLEACKWNLTRAARCLNFNSLQAFKNHLRRKFPRLDAERLNKSVQSPGGA
jgi:tetratricopeptide (TPR) repeat protein